MFLPSLAGYWQCRAAAAQGWGKKGGCRGARKSGTAARPRFSKNKWKERTRSKHATINERGDQPQNQSEPLTSGGAVKAIETTEKENEALREKLARGCALIVR